MLSFDAAMLCIGCDGALLIESFEVEVLFIGCDGFLIEARNAASF